MGSRQQRINSVPDEAPPSFKEQLKKLRHENARFRSTATKLLFEQSSNSHETSANNISLTKSTLFKCMGNLAYWHKTIMRVLRRMHPDELAMKAFLDSDNAPKETGTVIMKLQSQVDSGILEGGRNRSVGMKKPQKQSGSKRVFHEGSHVKIHMKFRERQGVITRNSVQGKGESNNAAHLKINSTLNEV